MKPSFTTPQSIEDKVREKEEREVKTALATINKMEDKKGNIDNFSKVYHTILNIYFTFEEEKENQIAELERQMKNDLITKTIFKQEKEKIEAEREVMKDITQVRAKELFERFNSIYTEQIKLNAGNLNDDDIKLLKSGIEFKQEELQEMADKYNESFNFTMLRLINDYANKRDMLIYSKSEKGYKKAIEYIDKVTRLGTNSPDTYHSKNIKEPHYRETVLDNFKAYF